MVSAPAQKSALTRAVPIPRVFDENLARGFYLGYLGFETVFEHRFGEGYPLYAAVRRDAVLLHLSGHHGDCTPGSAVFIELDDVDAYLAELQGRSMAGVRPTVEAMPWGLRQLALIDPFGNRLLFNSPAR